jgi:hypothetical protein
MEYVAKRQFNHGGVPYEVNKLVPVTEDESIVLIKYGFIKRKSAPKKTKQKQNENKTKTKS